MRAGLGATTEAARALPVQAAAAPWLGPAHGPLCHRDLTRPPASAGAPPPAAHEPLRRAAAGQFPCACSVRTDGEQPKVEDAMIYEFAIQLLISAV